MQIYNQDKTAIVENPDYELGYLKPDRITIHHEAVEGVEEVGHYETIAEYPNGGKDVEWIVEIPGVEEKEAYDEKEDIQVYIPYTEEELHRNALYKELSTAERWLSEHDYIGTKIATGRATAEEYAEEIAEMTRLAGRINEIKNELNL